MKNENSRKFEIDHLTSTIFEYSSIELSALCSHFNHLRFALWQTDPILVLLIDPLCVEDSNLISFGALKTAIWSLIDAPGISTALMATYRNWSEIKSSYFCRNLYFNHNINLPNIGISWKLHIQDWLLILSSMLWFYRWALFLPSFTEYKWYYMTFLFKVNIALVYQI